MRSLVGWLVAETISLTGTRLSMLALPWFALTTTGSATKTGLVAVAEITPMVALKILGGPWIDRLGARRVAIGCDAASSLAVALIPILYAAGALRFTTFLLVVGLAGALRGPGESAKQALATQISQRSRQPLERVTGFYGAIERTASTLGAGVGGILVAALGAPSAIALDAASFALSAAILAATTTGISPIAAAEHERYVRRLREGWDFLRNERVILGLTVMVALTNMIDQAGSGVLLPVWGHQRTSIALVGLVLAAFSAASAAGSVIAAMYAARLPRYWIYLFAFMLCGLPRFLVLAWPAPHWTIVATYVVAGFAAGFINPILGAVLLERIPERLVGRVMSLGTAVAWALMPLGGILGGGLVSGLGLTYALLIAGGAYFLVTLLPAVDRTWRQIDAPQSRASEVRL